MENRRRCCVTMDVKARVYVTMSGVSVTVEVRIFIDGVACTVADIVVVVEVICKHFGGHPRLKAGCSGEHSMHGLQVNMVVQYCMLLQSLWVAH